MTKEALEAQVIALLKEGKAIDAIKLVHEELQCGLKIAKDYVDARMNNMKRQ